LSSSEMVVVEGGRKNNIRGFCYARYECV